MKHAAAFLFFFVALWWLWMLLAGEWNHTEWIAASGAAAIGATIGEIARTRARATPGVRELSSAPSALLMVFVDFGIVLGALVTRRAGVFRETETSVTDVGSATYLATISPNAYVIDVDERRALTHHLVPFEKSQEPV